MIKKLIKLTVFLATILILALGGVAYYVYKNEDALIQKLITFANGHINGSLSVESVKLSPFENWPYISIDLVNTSLYESKDTSCTPIFRAKDIYFGFDIKKIIRKDFTLKSIKVKDGTAHIIHQADGSYNLVHALKGDLKEQPKDSIPFQLDLQKVTVQRVQIALVDEPADREVDFNIADLGLKLKYQDGHVFVDVLTDLHLDVLEAQEPTFFVNKFVHLDLTCDFDADTKIFQILPSQVTVAQAFFQIEGAIDTSSEMDVDIKLRGDKPDFEVFAAFLPEDYADRLRSYKNEGKIFFEGDIKGKTLNGNIPSIDVRFGCEQAFFLNPRVQKKVDQLMFSGSFSNGAGGSLETAVFRLDKFHARPEEGVFEGSLFIKNFKDPYVRVDLHADLDLEFLGKFFQIEDFEHVKGHINLDMNFDELIDLNLPATSLAKLKTGIDSELTITDLSFLMPEFGHLVEDMNGHAVMQDGAIVLDSIAFKVGKSDFWFAGGLSDFPAFFHKMEKPISLKFDARSKRMDFPDLFKADSAMVQKANEVITDFSTSMHFETKASELANFKYLPRGEFFIDDLYAKLQNYPHTFHDFHADIIITDTDLSLIDFTGEIDSTDFHFSGRLINYTKWFQPQPKGDSELEFDLTSNLLQFHDIFSYDGVNYVPKDYQHEEIRNMKLHGRVEMHYDAGFKSVDLYLDDFTGKMKLHPLKFEKFRGRAHVEGEQITIENFKGIMGQSDFQVDMSYYYGPDPKLKKKNNHLYIKSKKLDLDALMGFKNFEKQSDHSAGSNIFEAPFPELHIRADIGKLNYHKYWLEEFGTDLRISPNHMVHVDTLFVRVAEGNVQMKGYFNGKDPKNIYFNSTIYAQKVDVDKLLFKLDNFGQDILINENLKGLVSGKITSNFKMHPDLTPIVADSEAKIDVEVFNGTLLNFTPMLAMSKYFKDKNLRMIRFDTLRNTFRLEKGTLHIPNMNVNSSLGFIELSGRQHMDLSMEYFIRVPMRTVTKVGWRSIFGKKPKEEVDPAQIDEIVVRDERRKVSFLNLKVVGTPDDFKVSLGRDKSGKKS